MTDILARIAEIRLERLAQEKRAVSYRAMEEMAGKVPWVGDFCAAFAKPGIHIIAEVKKASPSKGILKSDLDPSGISKLYEQGGASAVSVLTEQDHFQGSISILRQVRASVSLPVLRKDFILDPYQVLEARTAGADSFLLIAALLDAGKLSSLIELGRTYGMEPLVEIHDEEELNASLKSGAKMIGINNRNLKTFHTDLNITINLAKKIPADRIIISESGIKDRSDILRLQDCGVRGFLIGETLVTSADPAGKLQDLIHG